MSTYDDIYEMWANHTSILKNRATVAVAAVCLDILDEDPGTANHAERVAWATESLRDATNTMERMMWSVLSDSAVRTAELNQPGSATDSQIKTAVANAVDTYAVT